MPQDAVASVPSTSSPQDTESPVLTTYPVIPDMYYFTDVAEPGDRIVIFVRATVAVVYRSVVIIADA